MHVRRHHLFTLEDYLEHELANEGRYEFCDGAIFAMAGGSVRHNELVANLVAVIRGAFPGCRTFASDQRIATADGVHTYPDVSVVCGEMVLGTYKGTDTLHNPTLLAEVLSPSTRDYDLGEKLEHYQTLPSLREVLLVDSERVELRHVRRTAGGWETRRYTSPDDVVDLAGGASLSLRAVYGRALG